MADLPLSGHNSESLVTHLREYQLPDGRPDVMRRKAELDALVESLTPGEVLYLRATIIKRRAQIVFANLDQLPAELVCMIATSLDVRDVTCCAGVSQGWRQAWTSEFAIRGMMRHFFPGLLQTTEAGGPVDDTWRIFQLAARRRHRRRDSRFPPATCVNFGGPDASDLTCGSFGPDETVHPDGLPSLAGHLAASFPARRRGAYSHGRVAWQFDVRRICLDNLRTRERRIIDWPEGRLHGTETRLMALTEKLVVLYRHDRHGFIVYHIDERKFQTFSLPSNMFHVYASELTVGILLRVSYRTMHRRWGPLCGSPYIWRWGGPLQEVPPSAATLGRVPPSKALRACGFLYHPWEKDSFFVFWVIDQQDHPSAPTINSIIQPAATLGGSGPKPLAESWPHDPGRELMVMIDEYRNGETLVVGRHCYLSTRAPTSFSVLQEGVCQRNDSYGGYTLCYLENTREPVPTFRTRIRFNTVTRNFSVDRLGPETFAPFGQKRGTTELQLLQPLLTWDGTDHTISLSAPSGYLQPVLRGFYFLTRPVSGKDDRNRTPGCTYLINSPFGNNYRTHRNQAWELTGDDDFLILQSALGYIAWAYREVPESQARLWDETLGVRILLE